MSVGLLLITHGEIGASLLAAAMRMLNGCPLDARALGVLDEGDCDRLRTLAQDWAAGLDTGDGVLVLTDLFGSTPANIAASLQGKPAVLTLSGVNLPMLVRILNYPDLPLESLAEKAYAGGRDGVMYCRRPTAGSEVSAEVCSR